jgi:hypothetical protein
MLSIRNHHASQAALAGVLAHDVAVGDAIGSPYLEDRAVVAGKDARLEQVRQHVGDADRLRRHCHPARHDHDGEALDQRADHLEREAARADHDRRPQLDDRHARRPQHVTDLLPTPEVGREIVPGFAEATQIDDAPHAGSTSGGAEVLGGTAIGLLERVRGAHRMYEVVGRVHARERRPEAGRIEQVSEDHLGPGIEAMAKKFGAPGDTAHPLACLLQGRQQPSADVAGRAGEQDESCGRHPTTRSCVPPASAAV